MTTSERKQYVLVSCGPKCCNDGVDDIDLFSYLREEFNDKGIAAELREFPGPVCLAAPELLAALEALWTHLDGRPIPERLEAQLSAAVAKAKGEAPAD